MKNITELIMVIGLLMQYGVAQASWMNWINDELLGEEQARTVKCVVSRSKFNHSLMPHKAIAKAYLDFEKSDLKDQKAYDERIKNIKEAYKQEEVIFIQETYSNACCSAVYLEERRNFIRSFATFGLSCLYLPQSESEKKYQDFKTKFNTTEDRSRCIYSDENICHWAIEQFNREQRVYQNRVVAAAGVVLISAVAGYAWANKK